MLCGFMLLSLGAATGFGQQDELAGQLKTIRAVGPKGQGHLAAKAAWKQLAKADAEKLPQVLAGMDGAGPLAQNWLRAAVDAIAERQLAGGEKLPQASLEKFLLATNHGPRARRLAYEWIARVDDTASARLIPKMLNDPSLELRRDAVAQAIDGAEALLGGGKKDAGVAAYQKAFTAARDIDQIKACEKKLSELGQSVDVPVHFGFLMEWKLAAPFDNTDKGGFDVAYAPEKKVDVNATYQGKGDKKVGWIDHVTADTYGNVDLTKPLGKIKGAVCYAVTEFTAGEEREVDFRMGTHNANKIWLNGKLLTANEVYHAAAAIDQYRARGTLKRGRNVILLKICQNEQTESWAQSWHFQLRVCDRVGTPVLSTTRPPTPKKKPKKAAGE
jgi:hypothetical protein